MASSHLNFGILVSRFLHFSRHFMERGLRQLFRFLEVSLRDNGGDDNDDDEGDNDDDDDEKNL